MLLVRSNWSILGALHWQKNEGKLFEAVSSNLCQYYTIILGKVSWKQCLHYSKLYYPTLILYICIQTHCLSWIMTQTNLETPWANKRTGPSSLVIYWHEWEIECHFSNKTDDFSNISRLARKTPSWQIWECQQEIPNILFPCCFCGDINNLTFVVLKSTKGGKIPETSFWWDYPKLRKVQESGQKHF